MGKQNAGKHKATAATTTLTRLGITFEARVYEHDPAIRGFGDEAAAKLGLDPRAVFKTLVVRSDAGRFGVAVVPVAGSADLKAVAACLDDKKAHLADEADVRRLTGYVLGGVSPVGLRTPLPTFVDVSARALTTMYVSGGRRGFDVGLTPDDLARATDARFAAIAAPAH